MSTPNLGAAWTPPPPAEIQTTSRKTKFLAQGIMPPSNVFIDRDDILNVFLFALVDNMTVTVRVRELMPDNTIQTSEVKILTNHLQFPLQTPIVLAEGFLLSVEIIGDLSNPAWGNIFASVQVVRGALGTLNSAETLCRGFASNAHPLNFPYGGIRSPFEGPGNLRAIVGTTPAAGAEINEIVPVGARWRLISLRFVLTTSVAVANRTPVIIHDDSANSYAEHSANSTQAASLALPYTYAAHSQLSGNVNGRIYIPGIPQLIIPAGHRFRTSTSGIQAADQYSSVVYLVEEWIG